MFFCFKCLGFCVDSLLVLQGNVFVKLDVKSFYTRRTPSAHISVATVYAIQALWIFSQH